MTNYFFSADFHFQNKANILGVADAQGFARIVITSLDFTFYQN